MKTELRSINVEDVDVRDLKSKKGSKLRSKEVI